MLSAENKKSRAVAAQPFDANSSVISDQEFASIRDSFSICFTPLLTTEEFLAQTNAVREKDKTYIGIVNVIKKMLILRAINKQYQRIDPTHLSRVTGNMQNVGQLKAEFLQPIQEYWTLYAKRLKDADYYGAPDSFTRLNPLLASEKSCREFYSRILCVLPRKYQIQVIDLFSQNRFDLIEKITKDWQKKDWDILSENLHESFESWIGTGRMSSSNPEYITFESVEFELKSIFYLLSLVNIKLSQGSVLNACLANQDFCRDFFNAVISAFLQKQELSSLADEISRLFFAADLKSIWAIHNKVEISWSRQQVQAFCSIFAKYAFSVDSNFNISDVFSMFMLISATYRRSPRFFMQKEDLEKYPYLQVVQVSGFLSTILERHAPTLLGMGSRRNNHNILAQLRELCHSHAQETQHDEIISLISKISLEGEVVGQVSARRNLLHDMFYFMLYGKTWEPGSSGLSQDVLNQFVFIAQQIEDPDLRFAIYALSFFELHFQGVEAFTTILSAYCSHINLVKEYQKVFKLFFENKYYLVDEVLSVKSFNHLFRMISVGGLAIEDAKSIFQSLEAINSPACLRVYTLFLVNALENVDINHHRRLSFYISVLMHNDLSPN